MTTFAWTVVGITSWLTIAVAVGLLIGRMIRGRDHHYPRPSPNHPSMRNHNTPTERPLTPHETSTVAKLEKQFTPDTQESQ